MYEYGFVLNTRVQAFVLINQLSHIYLVIYLLHQFLYQERKINILGNKEKGF